METEGVRQNIRHFDYLKALLMGLVILGHINFANQAIKGWIYAFHMPAFFFASGLLLKDRPVQGLRECRGVLWRCFQGLMSPYFIWGLVYASLNASNLVRILYGSHRSLMSAHTLTSLWFLPVLFEATGLFVLSQLVFKERLNAPVKLLLAAVSLGVAAFLPKFRHGYPWCLDVSLAAFGFLLMGNLLSPLLRRVQGDSGGRPGKFAPLWLLLAALSFAGTLLHRLNNPKFGIALMAEARYGNFPLFVLTACLGVSLVVFAGLLLDCLVPRSLPPKADILSFLGKNTLCAFVVHKPIIELFRDVFQRIPASDAVSLAVTFAGTAIGCCLLALVMNRHFPALLGKAAQRETSH